MNYKSQLKGWAIDRIIEHAKVSGDKPTLDEVMKRADELANYAYVGEEDFTDACKRVVECLKENPDALEKIGQLQNELAYLEEQMQGQLSRTKLNGEAKGAVQ